MESALTNTVRINLLYRREKPRTFSAAARRIRNEVNATRHASAHLRSLDGAVLILVESLLLRGSSGQKTDLPFRGAIHDPWCSVLELGVFVIQALANTKYGGDGEASTENHL